MFYVCILYSPSLSKYYVGSTVHVDIRIDQHNKGQSSFTKKGIPWNLIHTIECDSRTTAVQLEIKIKKRGIQRFLDDEKINN
ncbi:MAG: GIY-YIG nuclease family protein [Bacteroidota bacterium]|nr:GIY-YIG nuclease family protein [Bacteroidota bacterium]